MTDEPKKKRKKPVNPGKRKRDFREKIEAELSAMGFARHHYFWSDRPSCLVFYLDGAQRAFKIHAGMSRVDAARQMGRLETWAEVMNYKPRVHVPRISAPIVASAQGDLIALAEARA